LSGASARASWNFSYRDILRTNSQATFYCPTLGVLDAISMWTQVVNRFCVHDFHAFSASEVIVRG
jgi:hypothetical protein